MNRLISLSLLAAGAISLHAEEIIVNEFKYSGPIPVAATIATGDTLKVPMISPLDITTAPEMTQTIRIDSASPAPGFDTAAAIHVLEFNAENRQYASATLSVEGLQQWVATCDGKKAVGNIELHPATHKFQIKYVSSPDKTDSLTVKLTTSKDGAISVNCADSRMFVLDDVLCGTRVAYTSISPSGDYMLANYTTTFPNGSSTHLQRLFDTRTGKPIASFSENVAWMPTSDKLYTVRNSYENGRQLIAISPKDQSESILANNLPEGYYAFSPSEDYLLYSITREGPKENPKAYLVVEPDDRQPGWRDRAYPAILRLGGSNTLMPLAYGLGSTYVSDISNDGSKLLLMSSKSRLEKRPTTVTTVFVLDLNSMAADTIISNGDFINTAVFSPSAQEILVTGTPEAFNRIGCILPDSITPSMTQSELFIVNLATKDVRPITREFPWNPQEAEWSQADGKIYTRVEERDAYAVYRIDPVSCKAERIDLPEQIVKGISLSPAAPVMAWWGQSDSNPDRLYFTDMRKGKTKTQMLDAPSDERIKDVKLAQCQDWNFINAQGDTIYGRFYLPDNFDPEKKYPLIVNYYGGCSPSQRLFESRYPWHAYAPLGYIIYVVQPSGATGFGQEFSSRHVNTAGRGPAEDIIEGTQKFLAEHPYADPEKVGCIGASYGGFMTQYLQTLTDMFAAAISHAGISDHTSYWGEGYWGYSYSEVSMANSYPWSHQDLYVKQSPLYNADKIHTPILFLHGDSDTNVPPGESIQMFTALKLLGCPTALVEIQGQNHHITEFERRRLWQDTIFAWFAKYLQGDSSWWDALYPAQKEL